MAPEMAAAEVFAFLAAHPAIVQAAREAIQCGCSEAGIVALIKGAMTEASDLQMQKELGGK